jgi:hypothetical protein
MTETYVASRANFIYPHETDGDVFIKRHDAEVGDYVEVPLQDVLSFVADLVMRAKIDQLQDSEWPELLGVDRRAWAARHAPPPGSHVLRDARIPVPSDIAALGFPEPPPAKPSFESQVERMARFQFKCEADDAGSDQNWGDLEHTEQEEYRAAARRDLPLMGQP